MAASIAKVDIWFVLRTAPLCGLRTVHKLPKDLAMSYLQNPDIYLKSI